MHKKKWLIAFIGFLIALLPTYLIIYNITSASGLPDFSAQSGISVAFPVAVGAENREVVGYSADTEEYYLLTGILSDLIPIPMIPEDVDRENGYEITFISRYRNESTFYVYSAPDSLSTYLLTPTGKCYRFPLPAMEVGGNKVLPILAGLTRTLPNGGYALADENGTPDTIYQSPVTLPASVVYGDMNFLRFDGNPTQYRVTLSDASGATLATLGRGEAMPNVLAASATVTADFFLGNGVFLRASYSLLFN